MTPLALVQQQAEDEGLWFRAETITEDYLQRALRALHAAVERVPAQAPAQAPVALPEDGVRKALRELVAAWDGEIPWHAALDAARAALATPQGVDAARLAVIEECARVCDQYADSAQEVLRVNPNRASELMTGRATCAEDIAAAIRTLVDAARVEPSKG